MNYRPLLLVCAILAGCGSDEHQDIKQWMKEASADMHGRVQPIPEIKPFPIVSYDAGDFLEPFSPGKVIPEKRLGGGGVQPDFDRPKEPLEAFPLEALKLVGVVRRDKTLYGLVQAGNAVHQVKKGNHLGQSFGVITSVSESEIQLKELVQDPTGQTADWVERPATLQLQEVAEAPKEGKK